MTAPEYRTQVKRWFVEIGMADGGGIGRWIDTEESVEVAGEEEANALRDSWLASGKLRQMPWGELRPQNPYGLFRIRQVWEDTRATPAPAAMTPEVRALVEAAQNAEAALVGPCDDYEGCQEALDGLRAALAALRAGGADG